MLIFLRLKQEQIEKAAREFTDNLIAENHFDVNYEEDNYDAGSIHATDEVGVYAFTRGAEWRINSVWHDASEKPDKNQLVLFECRKTYGNGYSVNFGENYVLMKNVVLGWAYVKDLIPELETK